MSLVLYEKRCLHLDRIFVYNQLCKQAKREAAHYDKLVEMIDRVCELHAKQWPELLAKIKEAKLEARLLAKGTPVTEPLEPVTLGLEDFEKPQALSDAQKLLLKMTYKKVAMVLHPDRPGGDADLFDKAAKAYAQEDLVALQELYLVATKHRCLFWQQTDEALDYALTICGRPVAKAEVLRSTVGHMVAHFHARGLLQKASDLMFDALIEKLTRLTAEVNNLRMKNHVERKEVEEQGHE